MQPLPQFNLQFSRYSLAVALILHCGTMCVIFLLLLPWYMKLLLVMLPLSSLIILLCQQILRSAPSAIIKLTRSNQTWLLQANSGAAISAVLRGDSICTLYFVLLSFKVVDARKKISLIILPDALPGDSFRQLRRTLKNVQDG